MAAQKPADNLPRRRSESIPFAERKRIASNLGLVARLSVEITSAWDVTRRDFENEPPLFSERTTRIAKLVDVAMLSTATSGSI
jgi:hypothetical protein